VNRKILSLFFPRRQGKEPWIPPSLGNKLTYFNHTHTVIKCIWILQFFRERTKVLQLCCISKSFSKKEAHKLTWDYSFNAGGKLICNRSSGNIFHKRNLLKRHFSKTTK